MKSSAPIHQTPSRPAAEQQLTEVERKIVESVRSLRFGVVEVTIHDGRVVQIERREKMRMS